MFFQKVFSDYFKSTSFRVNILVFGLLTQHLHFILGELQLFEDSEGILQLSRIYAENKPRPLSEKKLREKRGLLPPEEIGYPGKLQCLLDLMPGAADIFLLAAYDFAQVYLIIHFYTCKHVV